MEKVFQIDRNFEIIINPDAVKLVPELAMISKDELRYVILVTDYVSSPYRLKPLDERKMLAIKKIWKGQRKVNDIESPKVKICMNEYEGLVFDIRRKTIDIYKKKITDLHIMTLSSELTLMKLKDYSGQIDFLQAKILVLEREINSDEENMVELKGGKALSAVELWQRRMKDFKKFQSSLQ